jgi:hypothetical protein
MGTLGRTTVNTGSLGGTSPGRATRTILGRDGQDDFRFVPGLEDEVPIFIVIQLIIKVTHFFEGSSLFLSSEVRRV